jgi:hypothetical protein
MRELVELVRIEEDLAQLLVTQHLLEDHARVQRDLLVLVSGERSEDDLVLCGEVLDGRPPRADLAAQEVVEDLDDVFAGLELEAGDVEDQVMQEVGGICFLGKLGDQFRQGVSVSVQKRFDLLQILGYIFVCLPPRFAPRHALL